MPETKMSKQEAKIEYPGTNPLDLELDKKDIKKYKKLAEENIKDSKRDTFEEIVPEKIKRRVANTAIKVLGGVTALSLPFALSACKGETPVVEEQQPEKEKDEVKIVSGAERTSKERVSAATIEKEKINALEIPGLTFNQETKSYFNETGVEVGVYVENAIEINGKIEDAVGLFPDSEILKNIVSENKEKGIFQFPWPFNLQESKEIKIVELASLNKDYKYIGIKYTEPVNLYAASDCAYGYGFKYIPQENDPSPFSSQDFSGSHFATGFETKNKDGKIITVDYEIEAVDWEPLVTLSEPWLSGRWEIRHFLEDVQRGQLIGRLLPTNPNYSSLDFCNRADWYKNPDKCQAFLWMDIFGDRLDGKSDLEKILKFGEGENRVTVFIWPGNQKTVPEKTN